MVYIIVELMKRIFSLSQSKYFWIVIGVISLCIGSYLQGKESAYSEYQKLIQMQYERNTKALQRLQQENQENEDRIVKEYVSQIEILKQKNEDISNAKISDVVECPRSAPESTVTRVYITKSDTNRTVSQEKSKSNLLCYTESQLRDKIKRSLDIVRECDELAVKYNSLYEVCK